jgi:CheY-like chemotaxis protein
MARTVTNEIERSTAIRPEDKTVLVVDDEEDIRDYLSTVLEDAGFNVMTAADGEEALRRVETTVPDFVSLDLVMPKKSGLRFLHDLRRKQEWRHIPVVVVTAHANDDLGQRDFQNIFSDKKVTGPSFYLEKPVDPDQYVGLICEKLGIELTGDLAGTDAGRLRNEAHGLIEQVDATHLPEIVRLLKTMR